MLDMLAKSRLTMHWAFLPKKREYLKEQLNMSIFILFLHMGEI